MGVNHYSALESNIYWFRVLGMAGHFQDFALNGSDFQPDGRLDGKTRLRTAAQHALTRVAMIGVTHGPTADFPGHGYVFAATSDFRHRSLNQSGGLLMATWLKSSSMGIGPPLEGLRSIGLPCCFV